MKYLVPLMLLLVVGCQRDSDDCGFLYRESPTAEFKYTDDFYEDEGTLWVPSYSEPKHVIADNWEVKEKGCAK